MRLATDVQKAEEYRQKIETQNDVAHLPEHVRDLIWVTVITHDGYGLELDSEEFRSDYAELASVFLQIYHIGFLRGRAHMGEGTQESDPLAGVSDEDIRQGLIANYALDPSEFCEDDKCNNITY